MIDPLLMAELTKTRVKFEEKYKIQLRIFLYFRDLKTSVFTRRGLGNK